MPPYLPQGRSNGRLRSVAHFPFRAGGAFSRWPIASLLRRPGAVSFNAFDCSDYKTKYAHLSRIFFILLQGFFYSPAKHRLVRGCRDMTDTS